MAPFATVTNSLPVLTDGIPTGNDLFNGNIRAMLVNVPQLGNANLYAYRYDQLNRIKAMNSFTGFNNSTNLLTTPTATENYKERVTYDPNGNIRTYLRDGDAARVSMDNLTYSYKTNTNQLDKVVDAAKDAVSSKYAQYNDIKKGQANGNYQYDAIGDLISDASEGITNIDWNVYGKISSITKSDGTTINYSYDVSGNRINKKVTSGGVTKTTVYVRDATGNVMSIYTQDPSINSGHFTQTEADMYGSSRLGVWNMNRDVSALSSIDYSNYSSTFERGNKFFELDNHLGNVLVTVSDKKVGVDTNSDGVIDYNTAETVSAQDYYPFGMLMPSRKYSIANTNYRYGFNGQQKSDEIDPSENLYTAMFWEYDSRIGRRWALDQVYKNSPYSTFACNPIWYGDPMGLDTVKNWQDAKSGDIWGSNNNGSTFYYKYNGKNWESNGVVKNEMMDPIVVSGNKSSSDVKRRFALAFAGMVSNQEAISSLNSLLEGTGVRLANAELHSFRFLGPAAGVASLVFFSGDNVTPQQRMRQMQQNINSALQDGDPLAAKDYINDWNNDERNKYNRIVLRYMSFGEFNNKISLDGELAVAPPIDAGGNLSVKYITPDVYVSSRSATSFLSLPHAPDIAIWTFENDILATKSPSGSGVYSKVKPKYGQLGGGREAVIVQPFPIRGFFPLIK